MHTHIVARAVSVKAYGSDHPSPRYSEEEKALCSGPGRKRSSRCSAEGSPHHAAGRQDSSRRAKSQGCHIAGTLRTTATRGCSMDGWTGALSSEAAVRSRCCLLVAARLLLGVVKSRDRSAGPGPVIVVVAAVVRVVLPPPPAASVSVAAMVEVVDEGVGGGDDAREGDGLGEAPGSRPPATMAR